MDVSIQSVKEEDLSTIGRMMTAYKMSMSINRLLWKTWSNETLQQEQTLNSVKLSFNDQAAQLLKAVDNKNGEILGFLVLTRKTPAAAPPQGESQPPSTEAIEVPERFNPEVFTTVIKAMGDIGKETESLDHLDISAFVVQHDHRRKGIGSQLLGVAVERARTEQVPLVMRSEPATHAFFKKHMFRETKVVDFDLAAWAEPLSGYGVFRLAGMIWYP